MPFSRNVTAATSPATARVEVTARASSRRSGACARCSPRAETPRARSVGIVGASAYRGAAERPRRPRVVQHQRLDFFPLLHRAPPEGRPHVTDALVSSALSMGAHACLPPLHHTTHAQRGARRWRTARASRTSPASRRTRRGMPSRKRPPPRGPRRWKGRSRRRGIPGRRHPRDRRRYQKHHQTRRRVALPSPRRARRTTTRATTTRDRIPNGGPPRDDGRGNRGVAAPLTAPVRRGVRVVAAPVASRPAKRDAERRTRDGEASAPPPPPPAARPRYDAATPPTRARRRRRETERAKRRRTVFRVGQNTRRRRVRRRAPVLRARDAGSRWPRWTRRNVAPLSRIPLRRRGAPASADAAARRGEPHYGWWCWPPVDARAAAAAARRARARW